MVLDIMRLKVQADSSHDHISLRGCRRKTMITQVALPMTSLGAPVRKRLLQVNVWKEPKVVFAIPAPVFSPVDFLVGRRRIGCGDQRILAEMAATDAKDVPARPDHSMIELEQRQVRWDHGSALQKHDFACELTASATLCEQAHSQEFKHTAKAGPASDETFICESSASAALRCDHQGTRASPPERASQWQLADKVAFDDESRGSVAPLEEIHGCNRNERSTEDRSSQQQPVDGGTFFNESPASAARRRHFPNRDCQERSSQGQLAGNDKSTDESPGSSALWDKFRSCNYQECVVNASSLQDQLADHATFSDAALWEIICSCDRQACFVKAGTSQGQSADYGLFMDESPVSAALWEKIHGGDRGEYFDKAGLSQSQSSDHGKFIDESPASAALWGNILNHDRREHTITLGGVSTATGSTGDSGDASSCSEDPRYQDVPIELTDSPMDWCKNAEEFGPGTACVSKKRWRAWRASQSAVAMTTSLAERARAAMACKSATLDPQIPVRSRGRETYRRRSVY